MVATGKPTRKPTVGPTNTPSPPRPPASNGAPSATTARNTSTAATPRHGPRIRPASISPIVWAVIGTPPANGSVICGTSPSAAINAANRATRATVDGMDEDDEEALTVFSPKRRHERTTPRRHGRRR